MYRLVLIPLFLLISCAAIDPDVRSAKMLCETMRATGSFTYTSNNMTPESCLCTMEYIRKVLPDTTWDKFQILLAGGDPFPAPELPASQPVGNIDEIVDAPAPESPPELLAIERVTNEAQAICLPVS